MNWNIYAVPPVDDKIYHQIKSLMNESLQSDWEKYHKVVHGFCMLIDESKKEDTDLEKIVIENFEKLKKAYHRF